MAKKTLCDSPLFAAHIKDHGSLLGLIARVDRWRRSVLIGTIFLLVCLIRAMKGHFTPTHHFGFEAAAWYWHFVDVVWLFLFGAIYWWGA